MAGRKRPEPRQDVLARLREICLALPGATEAASYGNPAFKVQGRPFAVLDHYRGADCVWVRCDPARRAQVLEQPGVFASPYDPKQTAVCVLPDEVDWVWLGGLIRGSWEIVLS